MGLHQAEPRGPVGPAPPRGPSRVSGTLVWPLLSKVHRWEAAGHTAPRVPTDGSLFTSRLPWCRAAGGAHLISREVPGDRSHNLIPEPLNAVGSVTGDG